MPEEYNSQYMTPSGYRWNKDLILPYESEWGIVNLFKYINRLKNSTVYRYFASEGAPLIYQDKKRFNGNLFIYDYPGSLAEDLGIPQKHFAPINYKLDIRYSNWGSYTYGIRYNVWYCPVCMSKYGYHSFFHQLCGEETCFIHRKKLIRTEIPYSLKTLSSDGPYMACERKYEDMFHFDDIGRMVRNRSAFRYRVLKADIPIRQFLFKMDLYDITDQDLIKWEERPFFRIHKAEISGKCMEMYDFLKGRCNPYELSEYITYPNRLLIDMKLDELYAIYGKKDVNKIINEYHNRINLDAFRNEVRVYDDVLIKEILLLYMFLGYEDIWILITPYYHSRRTFSDRYKLALYKKFVTDIGSRTQGYVRRHNVLPEEYYFSVIMAMQYMKDIGRIISDSEKCFEIINMKKRLPLLFYKLVDDNHADTISMFGGRAVQLDK